MQESGQEPKVTRVRSSRLCFIALPVYEGCEEKLLYHSFCDLKRKLKNGMTTHGLGKLTWKKVLWSDETPHQTLHKHQHHLFII